MNGRRDLSRVLEGTGPREAWPTVLEYREAKRTYRDYRARIDRAPADLLGAAQKSNYKLAKGGASIQGLELYPGTITRELLEETFPMLEELELPADLERLNVCRWSTPGCDPGRGGGCLGAHAGRNAMSSSARGKLSRSLFAYLEPGPFVDLVLWETRRAVERGSYVRLNVTSDLEWQKIAPVLFAERSPTRWKVYDYTKDHRRVADGWHLTYSASERHGPEEVQALAGAGRNVSVVLDTRRGEELPSSWAGVPVIDGDAHDKRWQDPPGVIVGLRAKDGGHAGLSSQAVGLRRFVKPAAVVS